MNQIQAAETGPYGGVLPANQAFYDQYMATLTANGYKPGARMDNAWWSQPVIQQADKSYNQSVGQASGARPNAAGNYGGAALDLPAEGDPNPRSGLSGIFDNPFIEPISDIIATFAGQPELIPFINAGETYAGGGNIGQSLLSGGEALAGQEALGSLGIGSGNSIFNNALGITGDNPSGFGLPDIGQGLSNFADNTGLSSLWGGTAVPSGDLSGLYNDVNTAAPNLSATAGATAPVDSAPGGASASYTAAASAPGNAGVGGGTLTGFGSGADPSAIGETSAIGSAQGGPPIDNAGTFQSDLNGNAIQSSSQGIGAGTAIQQPTGIGSTLSNIINPAAPNAGTFSNNIYGNPTGASSYSVPDQFSNAASSLNPGISSTGGGSSVLSSLSSMFSGSNTPSLLSMGGGLAKAGLGYLLNNNNSSGMNAITNASNTAAAGFAPYQAAGTQAENTLASLYGNNGTAQQTAAQQGFQNSPGYQFALNQGLNAINADAAAKGQTLSGNTMEGINNYAQGTASQQYNNYVNQLQNLASGGLSAAGGAGTAQLAGAGAKAQLGQNNANNENNSIGTGLSALFPSGFNLAQLLGNNSSANTGLLSLF